LTRLFKINGEVSGIMRFFHLADLHIGKRLGEFSLFFDQEYILNQILSAAKRHAPDAVIIAGDIYDKSAPAGEAVGLFDDFLTSLSRLGQPIMLISGNHDSPERLNFGGRIMARQNIHLAGLFCGQMTQIVLKDDHGETAFHLLPFIRPAQVRRFYPEAVIESYNDAVRIILAAQPPDPARRNVLVAHQYITAGDTAPERTESEQISVGGLDNIDASVFDGFDYVALGHLHRSQSIGGEHIRYAGSPLKYSFSEALHHKAITMVELEEKGALRIENLSLAPLHDMREIKGPIEKLLSPQIYEAADANDYLHITLTDEADLISPLDRLRAIYPNVMKLDFANSRSATGKGDGAAERITSKTPVELFADFYQLQQSSELPEDKLAIVKDVFAELEGKN